MVSSRINKINEENIKEDRGTAFSIGDTVDVHVKIKEGDKERIQVFKGTVIARDGGGSNETFTVHRVSHGIHVERVFPVHSPHIEKIKVNASAKVKRAKLYFLRDRKGKRARLRSVRKM
ncbi:MAG: 50S ribosomal protein L19 [Verrucomicrobiota bacterium]